MSSSFTKETAEVKHGPVRDPNREVLTETCNAISSVHLDDTISQHEVPVNTGSPSPRPVCQFYAKGSWCKFGNRCRFLHQRSQKVRKTSETTDKKDIKKNTQDGNGKSSRDAAGKCQKPETPNLQSTKGDPKSSESNLKNNGDKNVCSFFVKTGRCRFGARCRYLHPGIGANKYGEVPQSVEEANSPAEEEKGEGQESAPGTEKTGRQTTVSARPGKKKKVPACRFFRSGNCVKGDQCKFWHPKDLLDVHTEFHPPKGDGGTEEVQSSHGQMRPVVRPAPTRPQTEVFLGTASDEDLIKMRQIEVDQLKKRYPNAEELIAKRGQKFMVVFKPTDPDWVYDVKDLHLTVYLAEAYPKEKIKITIPDDQQLPDTVRRVVQNQLRDWLTQRYERLQKLNKAELVFRPFLKWLDKNLEDIFTDALTLYKKELMAQEAGIHFVSASQLQEQYKQSSEEDEDGDEDEEEEEEGSEDEEEGDYDSSEYEEEEDEEEQGQMSRSMDPVKRGTEVKLHNLQLKESAATMSMTYAFLIVQCSRCKNKCDLTTPADRLNLLPCPKCSGEQLVTFRPALVHQFRSVIGYLDLNGCVPHDLILSECHFAVACLKCNKEMDMQGLPPGQPKDTWCKHCHAKMRIAAEAVRFFQLQASIIDSSDAHRVNTSRLRKATKDPAIQEGKALPENGTCKHFKKSFRWLRFPCCGKAYPCDICHDEDNMDHDMKYANRMICGFCCKEQPYASERPCVVCQSSLTKKSSSHWEGGKGCRDRIKMARTDDHKYANMNKTLSRKSQAKKSGKKVTKLRHQ